jgi:hypothetical protein
MIDDDSYKLAARLAGYAGLSRSALSDGPAVTL